MNREHHQARRERAIGGDGRCRVCGFDDALALQQDTDGIICYECAQAAAGKVTVEDQHLVGRKVDPGTVGMPGNMHRVVDDAKYGWPEAVRKNTQADPLLWIAGLALSLRDIAKFLCERADRIGLWLAECAAVLRERFGDRWWEGLGIPALWG